MLAVSDGKLSIIQYLLKNGADTEITDYRKQKAADWAEERGNHEALSYITKHDQDKRKWMQNRHVIMLFSRGENDCQRHRISDEKGRDKHQPQAIGVWFIACAKQTK